MCSSGLPCLLQPASPAVGTKSNERSYGKSGEEKHLENFFAEVSASVDMDVAKFQVKAAQEDERLRRDALTKEAEAFAREEKEVTSWCKRKGYAGIDIPKVTFLRRKVTSPLHTAVSHQHIEMVALLVKHGADRGAKDSLNFTPRDYASKIRDTNVREAILSQLDC